MRKAELHADERQCDDPYSDPPVCSIIDLQSNSPATAPAEWNDLHRYEFKKFVKLDRARTTWLIVEMQTSRRNTDAKNGHQKQPLA
jgi:hypothetical protein